MPIGKFRFGEHFPICIAYMEDDGRNVVFPYNFRSST